ncbi:MULTISPECIES: hypothetical protein [unclassified Streptomyces]|uniref:hypothetical protein n=1 Tax=unclassified Streptomyces TaxID=2593676 RepID=UPI00136888CD|nr:MULTISPECIES: hypothetical protein [unclassified Streptomyces]MCW5249127.1 hypothetical protein [Streptomyces sp. SHP 1-2]MYU21370.1 hypothetical protein [Streptomyces sp. SID8352]
MSNASTNQPTQASGADVQGAATGHGRHRGPVSEQEGQAAPNGRHRRPAEEAGPAAA